MQPLIWAVFAMPYNYTIYLVLTLIITVRSVPPDISMISVVIRSTIYATIFLYRMAHITVLAMMQKCVLSYFAGDKRW